ncbi:hypothetical protein A1O3_01102 [Capronia epimyces CBS 606.96]|uniref:Uncharacterized protein n=1 Tax=Capronia epimyces CBS 606.96 TaxID=1182542 RepID=W9YSB5_9EURO|nr:uncharacterized protein A1O3_01102 [Capronia epimyces CBS 606.96]EXJ92550.1 hypothetical protein A1O3_01102 [Capronia epimyces CBS 606.96]
MKNVWPTGAAQGAAQSLYNHNWRQKRIATQTEEDAEKQRAKNRAKAAKHGAKKPSLDPDYAEKVSAANKACREKHRDELNAKKREVRAAKKVINTANSAKGQGSLDGFLRSNQDSTGRKQIQTLEAPTS